MSHKTKYAQHSQFIITLSEQVPLGHNEHLLNTCCKVATCHRIVLSKLALEIQTINLSNSVTIIICMKSRQVYLRYRYAFSSYTATIMYLLKIQTVFNRTMHTTVPVQ